MFKKEKRHGAGKNIVSAPQYSFSMIKANERRLIA